MRTRQEKVEETEQIIWNWLQKHYQESCYPTELGVFTKALCDFWEIYNDNKTNDNQFENNMKAVLEIEKKQAQINILNEVKEYAETCDEYNQKPLKRPFVYIEFIDEIIKEVKNEQKEQ